MEGDTSSWGVQSLVGAVEKLGKHILGAMTLPVTLDGVTRLRHH